MGRDTSANIRKGIDMGMGCRLFLSLATAISVNIVRTLARVWGSLNLDSWVKHMQVTGLKEFSMEPEYINIPTVLSILDNLNWIKNMVKV